MNLVLSLVALALGPLLYGACQKNDALRSALEGLLFVTIAGIVVVHIVPDVVEVAGFVALGFVAAGAIFASLVERRPAVEQGSRNTWIIFLGALGLMIHAAMDGIALLPDDHLHGTETDSHDHHHGGEGIESLLGNHLAIGVILHRVPVGMAIWWIVRPRLGAGVAVGALAIIAIATTAAYLLGEPVIEMMEARSFALFQAFVAGTLLHVIVHSHVQDERETLDELRGHTVAGERLGIVIGIILIFLVPHAH